MGVESTTTEQISTAQSSVASPGAIKAIPTTYHGYTFRSRLEARYAVFFECLGMDYEYEPEGFKNLSTSECYLPDFWLPQIGLLAEVKPTLPPQHGDQFAKSKDFVRAGMASRMLLLEGSPDFRLYSIFSREEVIHPPEFYVTNTTLDIYSYPKAYFKEHRVFEDILPERFASEQDFSEQYQTAVYTARSFYFGRIEYPTGIENAGPGLRNGF